MRNAILFNSNPNYGMSKFYRLKVVKKRDISYAKKKQLNNISKRARQRPTFTPLSDNAFRSVAIHRLVQL